MRISQGLVKVVFGTKENGQSHFKWYRISRTNLLTIANRYSSLPNFYYAKVYEYERLGKRKGNVKHQIAYINWDKYGTLQAKLV